MATNSSIKRKCQGFGQENVDSWSSTELEEETFTHLWKIKNYSALSEKVEIKSPVFLGGRHKWQLKIHTKKKFEEEEWFGAFLSLSDFGDGNNSINRIIRSRFQFNLLDARDKPVKSFGPAPAGEFKKQSIYGWHKIILTSELKAVSRPVIVDDTVKIHCQVWIECDIKEHTRYVGDKEERILKEKEQLQTDFQSLLQSTDFADVALNTGSRTFMAHKSVITCRSKVFAAMFANKMLESSMNTVEIPDFEEDVVENMLKYIYSGRVGLLLPDKASSLLRIAEKYDLPGLKKECEYTLASNLTVETSVDLLVLAHLHNADVLKDKVADFINRNKEEVQKTQTFQSVAATNPEVLLKLLYLSRDY